MLILILKRKLVHRAIALRHFRYLLLGSLLTFFGAGCGSIYSRPGATLPTDPCELLKMRVEEAQRAEKTVEQAQSRLRSAAGRPATIDLDRMEAATFEFGRHIAAISDVAPQCKEHEKFAPETERLEQQHNTFLRLIRSLRSPTE